MQQKDSRLTCPVRVDVLLQEINRAQADHKTPPKPERDNGSVLLVQVYEKLMQAATGYDIRKVSISGTLSRMDKKALVRSQLFLLLDK